MEDSVSLTVQMSLFVERKDWEEYQRRIRERCAKLGKRRPDHAEYMKGMTFKELQEFLFPNIPDQPVTGPDLIPESMVESIRYGIPHLIECIYDDLHKARDKRFRELFPELVEAR